MSWGAVLNSSSLVVGGFVAATTVMSIASVVAELRGDSSRVGRVVSTARWVMPKPVAMGKAGEICQSCASSWKAQGLEPKRLRYVKAADGRIACTANGMEIVICPYCDGDAILKLAQGV